MRSHVQTVKGDPSRLIPSIAVWFYCRNVGRCRNKLWMRYKKPIIHTLYSAYTLRVIITAVSNKVPFCIKTSILTFLQPSKLEFIKQS